MGCTANRGICEVSIPERVLEALKLDDFIGEFGADELVSIPERVLEALKPIAAKEPPIAKAASFNP